MADETYAGFLNSLVGTPEAVEAFQSRLTDYIRDPVGRAGDRYDRLLFGLTDIVNRTAQGQLHPTLTTSLGEQSREQVARVITLGVTFGVALLRAVGTLYQDNARVPQRYTNVQRNTARALGHAWSLANTDAETNTYNLMANHFGLNPRSPLTALRLRGKKRIPAEEISFVKAFRVPRDNKGQLELKLLYPNKRGKPNRHCPATEVRTEVVPGRTERSLWLFLHAIGGVVMTEIFPHQFVIVSG